MSEFPKKRRTDQCRDLEKTPAHLNKPSCKSLASLLVLFGFGLAIGFFALAPLEWPDRAGIATRCLGAVYGGILALFPGTLFFYVREKLKEWALAFRCSRSVKVSVGKTHYESDGQVRVKAVALLLLLFLFVLVIAAGAMVGAFVFAPWHWPKTVDIPRQFVGAALGMLFALIPGSLVLGIGEKLMANIVRGYAIGDASNDD